MVLAGPRLWLPDGISEGHVEFDALGRVLVVHEGDPGEHLDVEGLVTPPAVNAHTHIADIVARGRVEATRLEEIVAPPDGLKHRILRQTGEPELVGGMVAALREAHAAGVLRLIDFREGGPQGARLARQAAHGEPVQLTVLGRPSTHEAFADEADVLGAFVDGLGISGLADQPYATSEAQAQWCREHGKRVALHLSEGKREDTDAALALDPDLLVHAVACTSDDLARIADAQVPVALCPRSNALFGGTPPLEAMLEAGLHLGLGTDNAMFHATDVWQEAAYVLEQWPGLEPTTVLGMLTHFHLPGEPAPALREGAPAVVLDDGRGLDNALRQCAVQPLWSVPHA